MRDRELRKQRRDLYRFIASISIWGLLCCGALIMLLAGCKKQGEILTDKGTQPSYTNNGSVTANSQTEQSIEELVYYYCQEYGVDYNLACAVIEVESQWQTDANNGQCVGLMQLNTEYEEYFCDGAGVYDLTDPRQNVKAGIWHLSVLQERYTDLNLILMAWNMGESKAIEMWESGIHETNYTQKVRAVLNE